MKNDELKSSSEPKLDCGQHGRAILFAAGHLGVGEGLRIALHLLTCRQCANTWLSCRSMDSSLRAKSASLSALAAVRKRIVFALFAWAVVTMLALAGASIVVLKLLEAKPDPGMSIVTGGGHFGDRNVVEGKTRPPGKKLKKLLDPDCETPKK